MSTPNVNGQIWKPGMTKEEPKNKMFSFRVTEVEYQRIVALNQRRQSKNPNESLSQTALCAIQYATLNRWGDFDKFK